MSDVVVLGAGLSGLLAAAAAQRAGRRVTLVERDRLVPVADPRPGVPQGTQPHVLLHRGLSAMETLLPGLGADLRRRGGVVVNTARLAWLSEYGWNLVGDHGLEIVSLTRPALELAVRERVMALPGVGLVEARASGLARTGDGWRVTTDHRPLEAPVVVDATGRTSRMPVWLAGLGVDPGRVQEVDARLGYASRRYRGTAATGAVVLATPATCRGGLALPVEDGAWLVALVGVGEQRPPRDEAAFDAYLRDLPDPALADLVSRWTPDGPVAVHRRTSNVRHHYGSLRDWPPGLLVLGDALCAFDPVYGQGVTVAALQALVLEKALGPTATRGGGRPGRRLQRRLSRVADFPWAVATGEDLRFPTTRGHQSRSQALLSGWAREVGRLGVHGDLRASRTLNRVYHLVGSPLAMFHPALVVAVLRGRVLGLAPANPRPAALASADSMGA